MSDDERRSTRATPARAVLWVLTFGCVAAATMLARDRVARADAPTGRYTLINGATEVKDNVTGLVWVRVEETGTFAWSAAKTRCIDKGGGYRLPNVRELQSLVDETATSAPVLDKTAFPSATGATSWSSSADALSSGTKAWLVNFSVGNTESGPVGTAYAVRCVR